MVALVQGSPKEVGRNGEAVEREDNGLDALR